MKVLLLGDAGHGRTMEVDGKARYSLSFADTDRESLRICQLPEAGEPVPKPSPLSIIRYNTSLRLSTSKLQVMVCQSIHPERDKAVELMHNLAGSGSAEPTGLVVNGLAIYIAPGQHDDFTSRAIETLRKAINTSEKVFWQAVRDIADEIRGP